MSLPTCGRPCGADLGEDPVVTATSADRLAESAREAAQYEAALVAPGRSPSSIPRAQLDDVDADVLDHAVAELDVERAKGLEFDSVVVVEPAAHSAGQLYVALTRTTRRLVLVHSRPLPPCLRLQSLSSRGNHRLRDSVARHGERSRCHVIGLLEHVHGDDLHS